MNAPITIQTQLTEKLEQGRKALRYRIKIAKEKLSKLETDLEYIDRELEMRYRKLNIIGRV